MEKGELYSVKNELEQLDVELKQFKKELLAARIMEQQQIVRAPVGRSRPVMPKAGITTGD